MTHLPTAIRMRITQLQQELAAYRAETTARITAYNAAIAELKALLEYTNDDSGNPPNHDKHANLGP